MKVYVETSVISYLTSAPSRDRVVAAHQRVTREWWRRRGRFDLFVSEAVVQEAAAGEAGAAAKRTAALQGLTVLAVDVAADVLGRQLVQAGALPVRAQIDAAHVAVAAVNGLDRLLTWNCAHIATVESR